MNESEEEGVDLCLVFRAMTSSAISAEAHFSLLAYKQETEADSVLSRANSYSRVFKLFYLPPFSDEALLSSPRLRSGMSYSFDIKSWTRALTSLNGERAPFRSLFFEFCRLLFKSADIIAAQRELPELMLNRNRR